ncbi:MAG: YdaU family protein [Novosphingobium sp.]|nr:YdaU family protein [Novosphingobium sp.]
MTELPEPLTPADCDLRDFQFMPIDIVRLFGSRFHAVASDAEWRAGITLWLKSFHQVPAASIPDDEVELARLAEFGRDLKSWRKVRTVALHGWVKCNDGRFYHPVVAEKAAEAYRKKEFYRDRSKKANAKRWGNKDNSDEPAQGEGLQTHGGSNAQGNASENQKGSSKESIKDASRSPSASQGTVKGQGEYTVPSGTGGADDFRADDRPAPEPPQAASNPPPDDDPNRILWANGVTILGETARPQIARWIKSHGTEIVGQAFERALVAKPERPAGYIQSILTRLAQEASQRAEEQRQADALFDARYPPREMSEFEARALMPPEDFQRWQARQLGAQA